jgi:RNA polymerase sigma-70 factor (ECF subfamily)
VLLRDMQELSYEEIGEVLGLPPGTVRSRIHRGRLILQEKLKGFVS